MLSSVHTIPCSRAVCTSRERGCLKWRPCPQPVNTDVIFDIRIHGPCPGRVHGPWTRVSFLTSVFTDRVRVVSRARRHGRRFGHPCSRAVDTGSVYRALGLVGFSDWFRDRVVLWNFNGRSDSKGQYAISCQISWLSVEPFLRDADFPTSKMAVFCHLVFLKARNFNGRLGGQGQNESPRWSVNPLLRYGGLSIFFQYGGHSPSWICYARVWITYEEHLVVSLRKI